MEIFYKNYPVRQILALIGDMWTPVIIHCLSEGTLRFNELQKRLPDISKKMLTQVLRRLEHDGLVHRKVYKVVPPKTEYSLTEQGQKIHEPINHLCAWAREHQELLSTIHDKKVK